MPIDIVLPGDPLPLPLAPDQHPETAASSIGGRFAQGEAMTGTTLSSTQAIAPTTTRA
jgi:hypothetical protein